MATKRYTEELLREAVANCDSYAGVLRYLGLKQAGGAQSNIVRRIKKLGIDTSHMSHMGGNKNKRPYNKRTPEQVLVIKPEGSHKEDVKKLRDALTHFGVAEACKICGLTDTWQGQFIRLQVDHISGDWLDNRLENLRYLCPNCHSQQPTSRGWGRKIKRT